MNVVTVGFRQEHGETICELTQQMPMENESTQTSFFIECGKGWTFYVANLKSVLEGGIDLRNKNGGHTTPNQFLITIRVVERHQQLGVWQSFRS